MRNWGRRGEKKPEAGEGERGEEKGGRGGEMRGTWRRRWRELNSMICCRLLYILLKEL